MWTQSDGWDIFVFLHVIRPLSGLWIQMWEKDDLCGIGSVIPSKAIKKSPWQIADRHTVLQVIVMTKLVSQLVRSARLCLTHGQGFTK